MPNRAYAKEWLEFAIKNLETAQLLYNANHYEDIIGVEIQQSLEKILKSLLAYKNIKIPKTHKLVEILEYTNLALNKEEKFLLEIATDYYRSDRYPNPNYTLPSREEIKEVLDFTKNLFGEVCKIVNISKEEFTLRKNLL